MNLLVLEFCILYIIIHMDLYLVQTLEWDSLIKKIIDKQRNKPFEKPSHKDLIVFLVSKPSNLRSKKIKDKLIKINNVLLEPYKSLQMAAHQEMRSKLKGENKIKKKAKDIEDDENLEIDEVTENDEEPEKYEDAEKDESSVETFGGLKLTKEQSKMLRQRWNRSCDKKATKVCKKACKLTYKSVCRAYRCFKSQKRSFRRQCSRNCRMKFRG